MLNRVILYLYCVGFSFLPIEGRISTLFLIGAGFLTVISFSIHKINFDKSVLRVLPFLVIPYILIIVGLLYTENKHGGFKYAEHTASILFIPVLLSHKVFREGNAFKLVMETFTISLITKLFYEAVIYLPEANTFQDFFLNFSADLTENGVHPAYFSSFLGFIFIYNFQEQISPIKRSYYGISKILLTLIFILLLSSKIVIAVVIVFLFTEILKGFLHFTKTLKISLLSIIILIILLLYHIPNRATQEFSNYFYALKGEKPVDIYFNDIDFDPFLWEKSSRIVIWRNSLELASNIPFYGVGTGDVQNELNKVYKKNKELWRMQFFNSHNQFLDYYLRFGILGVISLIFIFYIGLKAAIKSKNTQYAYFLILMIFCCSVENYLSRQWGVVFFTTFNTLFLYNSINHE